MGWFVPHGWVICRARPAGTSVGKGLAGPRFHPVAKGSSMAFAVLQLLMVCYFGQYFPKFKRPGQGKRIQQGEGTTTGLLYSQLPGGGDKEGKPSALNRKSSEVPRVGLGTSQRINRTLSVAEFYTSLYLTHHNWAKLSGLSFITVQNHQPSTVTGRGLLEKNRSLVYCAPACLNSPRGDSPRIRYGCVTAGN